MKVGIIPVNVGVKSVADMVGLAQLAESLGYESVWTFEHVIVPVDYQSKYPYHESGKMGVEPDANFVDPLIALAAVAAATKTIRLATGVNILSQANPLYLAKQAASLDFVSGGRFSLGIGIGWLQEEFAALGVPFARRGARFDDYVQAMRKVWSGEVVEHQSDFISWHGFKSYPLPVQNPLPLVMGGNKGKIFERTAKYGNGWYAPTTNAAELKAHLQQLQAACEAIGRNPADLEITCMWGGKGGKESLAELAAAGAHRVVMPLLAAGPDVPTALTNIAQEVIAA